MNIQHFSLINHWDRHITQRERLTNLGYPIAQKKFTQEDYARRFLTAIRNHLENHHPK